MWNSLSLRGIVSEHEITFVNRRHITLDKLEAAKVDLINRYYQYDLPKGWGDENVAAADGTQVDLYENNLVSSYHNDEKRDGSGPEWVCEETSAQHGIPSPVFTASSGGNDNAGVSGHGHPTPYSVSSDASNNSSGTICSAVWLSGDKRIPGD